MADFRTPLLTLLFTLALAPAALAGTLYKWVDEDGTVHFGETPPDGVEATPVSVDLEPDPVTDPYPKAGEEEEGTLSLAEQRRQEREERQEAARLQAERIAAECAAQRSILERIEPRPNVIYENPDGTVTRMDDDERVELINKARDFIAANCEDN